MAVYYGHMTKANQILERIESARASSHRSVIWLSERTGIADKTLRRRLAAPECFTLAELSAICTALGIELEKLFENQIIEQAAA